MTVPARNISCTAIATEVAIAARLYVSMHIATRLINVLNEALMFAGLYFHESVGIHGNAILRKCHALHILYNIT